MASAMKFLFENSFDVAERPAGLSPAAPQRQFTEEDILAARDEGFVQGEAAGRAAALTSIEQASAKTLTVIGARLNDAGQEIERIRTATVKDAMKVLGAAIRKVVPELARRNALNEIERLVRECLQAIYDEPRVVVRGHDRIIAALQPRIDDMATSCGFHGKIVLFADDQLNETDCRVEWADGGAERNLDDMWRQIDAAIERIADDGAAAPAVPETSKP
jgi:flagellar assembly protein FliH